jgi:hypothetical protein
MGFWRDRERSLHFAGWRSQIERKRKPARSGRDDTLVRWIR